MTTVAQIAALAFDGVAAEITDAIQAATLDVDTQGAYNATTGVYAVTTVTNTGRAVVDTVKPITDVFPAYVAGPSDELVLLEGFTSAPKNGRLTFAGRERVITETQDIVAAGSLFYVVAI